MTSKKDAEIMVVLDSVLGKKGMSKSIAYDIVAEKCEVPKPTVRRVARELKKYYAKRIKQLQNKLNYQKRLK